MKPDVRMIIKLTIWSFIVGVILYWLGWSPGDIYSWVAGTIAGIWGWLVGTGLQYILLGATIVVPVYFLLQFKNRKRR